MNRLPTAPRWYGKDLRAWQREAGISVEEMVRVLGVSRRTLYRMFNDEREIPSSIMFACLYLINDPQQLRALLGKR